MLICVVLPYLLGSLSFAIIVSKLFYHQDIRNFGSGNAGMTNILRTFGKKAAFLTFAGDIGKGILAVFISKQYLAHHQDPFSVLGVYLAAFFAVIGHIYPIYFGLKGGKAVSVATGAILIIQPVLIIPLFFLFFLVFAIWKMVSLSSIVCAVIYPVLTFCYYQFWNFSSQEDVWTATIGAFIMAVLVIWLHRSNLKRIVQGQEYKFLQKQKK